MRRILVVLVALLLATFLAPRGALAFGVKDVVAMSQYGIPDSLIIEKVRHSGTQFDLKPKDLIALKAAKVSDDVIVAMLRTEDRNHRVLYYDGRYWPYGPPWLGLDLGYYGPYRRVYAPFYGRPGWGFRGSFRFRR